MSRLLLHGELQLEGSSAPISVRSHTGTLISPWGGGHGGLLESGTEQERFSGPLALFCLSWALLLTGEPPWDLQSRSSAWIVTPPSCTSSAQSEESQPLQTCTHGNYHCNYSFINKRNHTNIRSVLRYLLPGQTARFGRMAGAQVFWVRIQARFGVLPPCLPRALGSICECPKIAITGRRRRPRPNAGGPRRRNDLERPTPTRWRARGGRSTTVCGTRRRRGRRTAVPQPERGRPAAAKRG